MNGNIRPFKLADAPAGKVIATYQLQLERVFVIGRFYRAMPGTMKLRENFLGGGLSAIDDPVQRLQMTRLVASGMIDVAAPAQARMRQRQALLGDFEKITVPDHCLEAKP